MTAKTQREALMLGVLVVVLGAVVWYRFAGDTPVDATSQAATASRPSNQAARGAAAPGRDAPVADVRLELLSGEPTPLPGEVRNPFRFGAQVQVAPAGGGNPGPRRQAPPPDVYEPPPVPTGPPPPPPIPLRFIGVVDERAEGPRVAVLSDGRGTVVYGKEGDIIEGRYRVLRISADSADLSYTDGRGRQTLRLSGQ